MIRLAARRLVQSVVTLAALSLLSFTLMVGVPGSYYDEARADPRISAQTIHLLRTKAGELGSLPSRYWQWCASVVRGEGGYSIAYQMPVLPLILPRLGKTLQLAAAGALLSWLMVVMLSLWAAKRGGWRLPVTSAVHAVLSAVPELVLACGLLAIALHLGWIRQNDIRLPAIVLGLSGIPMLLPQVSAALRQVAAEPYLMLAQAHGIRGWRYALIFWWRAASVPLIALAGTTVGTLLSSTLVVEIVCGWPGIGPLFLSSVEARDTHVVLAMVLLSCGLFVTVSLVSDLLLACADPRLRGRE